RRLHELREVARRAGVAVHEDDRLARVGGPRFERGRADPARLDLRAAQLAHGASVAPPAETLARRGERLRESARRARATRASGSAASPTSASPGAVGVWATFVRSILPCAG